MWHSEINNLPDEPMRFIQMWFLPSKKGMAPSVEQKAVIRKERINRLLPLVSNRHSGALRIISAAEVYSCFLQKGKTVEHALEKDRGVYLYILEGGEVFVNGNLMQALAAAMVIDFGDRLLEEIGRAIKAQVRANDTVARLGGDEFAVILEHVRGRDEPRRVAEKIIAALAQPTRVEGHEVHAGVSVGIALYPQDALGVPGLLRRADTALYDAKDRGKGAFRFFEAEMDHRMQRRLKLERELRQACARAFNTCYADLFREFSDRLTPAATIPLHTPEEACAELEYAVKKLGLKVWRERPVAVGETAAVSCLGLGWPRRRHSYCVQPLVLA